MSKPRKPRRIKKKTILVPILFHEDALPLIDRAVEKLDTDRCKFVRSAVQEKVARVNASK